MPTCESGYICIYTDQQTPQQNKKAKKNLKKS